ncbi:Bis(5'-adenosyl)-triphosphatase enpp4 [Homalodisca vitripennis]|nr:Bis(5'-adenosyl)-triphosphatase enpp4 [Homalodisca vitripennis]
MLLKIQNEKAGGGRTSGCMSWPGCEFKYQDSLPTYNFRQPFSSWEYRIDLMVDWFTDQENPANLVMAHFENPDEACHLLGGPDSKGVNEALSEVEDIVKYMLKRFEEEGLQSRLNIMFVSDHGCVRVHQPDYIIYLDEYVDKSLYIRSGESTSALIYPIEGN